MALAFPFPVEEDSIRCHFDCKIRRLFVHAVRAKEPEEQSASVAEPEVEVFEESRSQPAQITEISATADDEDAIEEIDTDEHFGRGKDTGKVQTYFKEQREEPEEPKKTETKEDAAQEDDADLLFDLC